LGLLRTKQSYRPNRALYFASGSGSDFLLEPLFQGLQASEWEHLKQLALGGEENLPWRNHWDFDSKVTWGVLGELLRAKVTTTVQYDDITVMIMQLRRSEYFAVVGPCKTYLPFRERQITYLVFPYIEPA
jgi:hypothetical protein